MFSTAISILSCSTRWRRSPWARQTPAPSSRSDDAREVRHFQWGLRFHETCQYNFFYDDKFFCVRLIEVRGFRHQSAWVYDGEVRELLDAADVIERDGDDHLKIRTPRFLMESDDAGGAVTVLAESGSPGLEMRWTTPILSTWFTPGEGSARHEPLLAGEVIYEGQVYHGPGFCKRAWFELDPEYFAWRFIEGAFDDGAGMIWSADAFFGTACNDYLKVAYADGRILAADGEHTHHRDNIAYGAIDGKPIEAEVEEMGLWKTKLLGEDMDCLLRQGFCKLTVRHDHQEHTGYALHEMGIGTMR